MCGRFTLTTKYDDMSSYVQASLLPTFREQYRPKYNIAPTSEHWIVHCEPEGARAIVPGRWGMPSPFGPASRDPVGHINARSETVAAKPSFREAFCTGRCGILADGFYEWSGSGRHRKPHWFHRAGRKPLVFAGIYRDELAADTGVVTRRFTILTCEANQTLAPFHQRMPVILGRDTLGDWLRPAAGRDRHALWSQLGGLLRPAADDLLQVREVSTRVNSTRFDDPACLEPPAPPAQPSLF